APGLRVAQGASERLRPQVGRQAPPEGPHAGRSRALAQRRAPRTTGLRQGAHRAAPGRQVDRGRPRRPRRGGDSMTDDRNRYPGPDGGEPTPEDPKREGADRAYDDGT